MTNLMNILTAFDKIPSPLVFNINLLSQHLCIELSNDLGINVPIYLQREHYVKFEKINNNAFKSYLIEYNIKLTELESNINNILLECDKMSIEELQHLNTLYFAKNSHNRWKQYKIQEGREVIKDFFILDKKAI